MENSAKEGTQYTLNDITKLSKLCDNEISEEEITQLVELCQVARENSYSPYSKFRVGSCLLTEDGKFIKGKINELLTLRHKC
jgi:cytidine deaminase